MNNASHDAFHDDFIVSGFTDASGIFHGRNRIGETVHIDTGETTMTNPEDETRQTFCADVRCNERPHIQGGAGCLFARPITTEVEKLVERLQTASQWCSGYEPSWSLLLRDAEEAADRITALSADNARKDAALREGEAALDAAVRTINAPDGGDALDALQVVRGKIALRAALATTEPNDD